MRSVCQPTRATSDRGPGPWPCPAHVTCQVRPSIDDEPCFDPASVDVAPGTRPVGSGVPSGVGRARRASESPSTCRSSWLRGAGSRGASCRGACDAGDAEAAPPVDLAQRSRHQSDGGESPRHRDVVDEVAEPRRREHAGDVDDGAGDRRGPDAVERDAVVVDQVADSVDSDPGGPRWASRRWRRQSGGIRSTSWRRARIREWGRCRAPARPTRRSRLGRWRSGREGVDRRMPSFQHSSDDCTAESMAVDADCRVGSREHPVLLGGDPGEVRTYSCPMPPSTSRGGDSQRWWRIPTPW